MAINHRPQVLVNSDEEPCSRRKEISIKMPFGQLNIRGYDLAVVATIVLCCLFGGMFYLSAKEHAVLAKNQEETLKALIDISYILYLDPEERRALKLQMPESLRRRIDRN